MANSKDFQFNIITFDGNPSSLDFFFNQIRCLAKSKKLTDEQTIQLLGSKLSGPAFTYFMQNPQLYKSNDLNFVEKELRTFFPSISKTNALIELNDLKLLPQESIRNFAHRLNLLTDSVYNDIKDENALNCIKMTKFISSIPSNLSIKLQEEGINKYDLAVKRAQILQDIFQNRQILQACPSSTSVDSISKQLVELTQKINAFTFSTHDKRNDSDTVSVNKQNKQTQHKYTNFKNRHFGYQRPQNHQTFVKHRHMNNQCQLCFKNGHTAKQCFKWKRSNFTHKNMCNKNNHTSFCKFDKCNSDKNPHLNS